MGYFLMVLAVSLLPYIFLATGLHTLANRRGISNSWLAWIPLVGNFWIIGSLSDQYMELRQLKSGKYRYRLLTLGLLVPVLWWFFGRVYPDAALLITFVFYTAYVILLLFTFYTALYRVFKSCQTEGAVGFLICCLLVSVITPFLIFAVRNKDEGMIPPAPNSKEVPYRRNYYDGGFSR